MNRSGKLELIIGPMFSGKSTELIRKIRIFKSINKKILVIKPLIDNRYELNKIVSHNKDSEDSLVIDTLESVLSEHLISYDVIIIDEAQFFKDLKKYIVDWVDNYKLHIIIGGLDGDFKRQPIGEILDLIPYADEYKKLKSMCKMCNDETLALFTHRKTQDEGQVLIGSDDHYIPLCRYHFLLENK